jgi:hypothetical protein
LWNVRGTRELREGKGGILRGGLVGGSALVALLLLGGGVEDEEGLLAVESKAGLGEDEEREVGEGVRGFEEHAGELARQVAVDLADGEEQALADGLLGLLFGPLRGKATVSWARGGAAGRRRDKGNVLGGGATGERGREGVVGCKP